MFRSSFKIATVWGIPIKVHISLIIVMVLYALRVAPDGHKAVLAVLLLVTGLFTSVALHELGHSFVALRKGCRVREITLLFIGGAAMMEDIPRKPKDEFQMAIAGPMVSLAIGALLFFGSPWLFGAQSAIGEIFAHIGFINFVLAGFNLLPSFPMDGGRVFRAMLTPKLGRLKATWIASRLGKLMAVAFGIYGLMEGGFFLVAIAFFIYTGAENEYRMVAWQEKGGSGGFRRPSVPPPFDPSATYTEPDDDEVSISPPPYKQGPGYRAPIRHEEDDNPFRNLFRR